MVTRSKATAARWDVLGPQRLVDRGVLMVFGFFMTSLGLGGVRRFQLLSVMVPVRRIVVRKIGDFLRKTVQKAMDAVVRVVSGKLKGLFAGKHWAGAQQEENDDQNQVDNPALTAGDHPRHERFVNERQGLQMEEK